MRLLLDTQIALWALTGSKRLGKTAGSGRQAPEKNAPGHQLLAVAIVSQAPHRNAHQGVEQGKREALQQTYLRVADTEIRLDGLD